MQMTIDDTELVLRERIKELEDWCKVLSVTLGSLVAYMQYLDASLWLAHAVRPESNDELVKKCEDVFWRVQHLDNVAIRNRWGMGR